MAAALLGALLASAATFELRDASTPGSFDVLIDGTLWFAHGAPTTFRRHGQTLSSADGTLALFRVRNTTGADAYGRYARRAWEWDAGAFETAVRVYEAAGAIVFEQTFARGADGAATGDVDGLISTFPSFAAPPSGETTRGYLSYQDIMVGASYHLGVWNADAGGVGSGIGGTGPLCVFTRDGAHSVLLSPASAVMAASQTFGATHSSAPSLSYGLMGNISSVPRGFSMETMLVHSQRGINAAFTTWGDLMLARSGKTRRGAWERDMTLRSLGYSTDNGAYYYYHTEPGRDYARTIVDVAAYAESQRIPYRYWLADSWWYYKGATGGVTNWTAMPEVFPHGFAELTARTGWGVMAHNRYWDAATPHAKSNGGAYDFLTDGETGYALPTSGAFWDDLMRNASR